ncbi:histidine phosphatase family protein [Paenibacillus marinisediminis]
MSRRAQVVRIAVLRHGVTRENAERRYVSRTDAALLPEARAALAPARRRLAAERPLAFASDMRRCIATLERVSPRTAPPRAVVDARLRELDFGRWEGLTYADLQADAQYCAWLDDMTAVIPPGGESWQQFAARTEEAWRAILERARLHHAPRPRQGRRARPPIAVLIVTHGGVVRRLHSLAWPAASFWDVPAPTGGGFVIVAQRQGKRYRFLRTEPLTR